MAKIYEYLKDKANGDDNNRTYIDYTIHRAKERERLFPFEIDENYVDIKYTYKELFELVNKCICFLRSEKDSFNSDLCFLVIKEDISDIVTFIACLELGLKPVLINKHTLYELFMNSKVKDNANLLNNVSEKHIILPSIEINKTNFKYSDYHNLRDGNVKSGIHVADDTINYLLINSVNFDSIKNQSFDFGLLSSGTTNKSKIIPIKENDLVNAIIKKYDLEKEETYITAMPISAISGLLFTIYLPIVGNNKTICNEKLKIYPELFDYKHINIILPSNYMRRDGNGQYNFAPLITHYTKDERIEHIILLGDKVHQDTIDYFHDILKDMPNDLIESYYGRTENFGLVSKINEKDMKPVYIYFQEIYPNRIIYTYNKEDIFEDIIIDGKRITRKVNYSYNDYTFYEVMPIAVINTPNEDIKIKEEIFSNIVADGKVTDDFGFILDNKIYYLGRENELFKVNDHYFYTSAFESKLSPFGIDKVHCTFTDDGINIYITGDNTNLRTNNYQKAMKENKNILEIASSLPLVKNIYFIERKDIPVVGAGGKISRKKLLDYSLKYGYGKYDSNFDFKKIVEEIISETLNKEVNLNIYNNYFIFPKSLYSINDIVKVIYLFRTLDYREDEDNYYLAISDEFLFLKGKKEARNTINAINKLDEKDLVFNDYIGMVKSGYIRKYLMLANELYEKKTITIYLLRNDDYILAETIREIDETGMTQDYLEYKPGVEKYAFDIEISKFNDGYDRGLYKIDNDNNFYVGKDIIDITVTSPELYKVIYNFILKQNEKDKEKIKIKK